MTGLRATRRGRGWLVGALTLAGVLGLVLLATPATPGDGRGLFGAVLVAPALTVLFVRAVRSRGRT